jgi:DNA-binding response OmpR family regulator
MEYNYETNCITKENGKMIILNNIENELFNYLYIEKRGKVCSPDELSYLIYGAYDVDTGIGNIRVYIYRLRKKIGKIAIIRNIKDKGYVID